MTARIIRSSGFMKFLLSAVEKASQTFPYCLNWAVCESITYEVVPVRYIFRTAALEIRL